jgi:hypothetical protein
MRRSITSIQRAVAAAALITSGTANASGVFWDLRFADGSHVKNAIAGQTYNLELWARVSGTNGNIVDEGIKDALISIASTQLNGGAVATGGITSVTIPATFQSFSGTTPQHSTGTSNDITNDGIIDWGGTSTSSGDPSYIFPHASGFVTSGGATGAAVDANTWEFLMASLTVTVNSLTGANGTTTFNSVKPNATGPGLAATYIFARVDNAIYNVASNNATNIASTYNNSQGVTFIPEPTTITVLGAASIALLRRRKSS